MNNSQITRLEDLYSLVDRLKSEAEKHEDTALASRLENALCLGSSGLEILGAIREVLIERQSSIVRLLGSAGADEVKQAITFIDKAFGRR
jgi:hypothetical protein